MANPKAFLLSLEKFDFSTVSDKQVKAVMKSIEKAGDDINPEVVKKKSIAAADLAAYVTAWVSAAASYQDIQKLNKELGIIQEWWTLSDRKDL